MTTSTASSRNIKSKEYTQPYMPVGTYTAWQRPSDWLTLPSLSPTVVFVGLVAVFDDTNNYITFGSFALTGNYTIDWGDGTSDTTSGAVVKNHKYNFSDLSSSTLTTRGYRQAIVTVTMTSGSFYGPILTTLYSGTAPVPTAYNANWLDILTGASTINNLYFNGGISTVTNNLLENINVAQCATSVSLYINNSAGLKQFNIPSFVILLNGYANLFTNCYALLAAPMMDTSSTTSMSAMFSACYSLQYVPPYITSNVTSMQQMFNACYRLKSVPFFDTSKVTTFSNMFTGCTSLGSIPWYNTSNVTNMTNMFDSCSSLVNAPELDTSKVINTAFMFTNCVSLETVPTYNLANCANTISMFNNCYNLKELPLFDTGNVLNTNSMLVNCYNLQSIPNLNLTKVTNAASMFSGCSSVADLSFIDISNVTVGGGSLFSGCFNLVNGPTTVNMSNVTTGGALNLFSTCYNLQGNITINVGATTSLASSFNQCQSLEAVTINGGNSVTSYATAFNNCKNLRSVVLANTQAVASTGSMFATCNNLNNLRVPNLGVSFSVASTQLDNTALETVFNDLRANATAQTATITSALGAVTSFSSNLTASQPIGTIILTVASSTNYQIGWYVTNSVCFAPAAVTMQDAGDTVTRTSHGLSNGTRVSFATIVSTTGISINTIYYVVNATTNTFQVSLTNGGAALPLTTNGSGTLRFEVQIIDKPSSTQVTVSAPTTATTTATALLGRPLNTYLASLKNWVVTG